LVKTLQAALEGMAVLEGMAALVELVELAEIKAALELLIIVAQQALEEQRGRRVVELVVQHRIQAPFLVVVVGVALG
jgi:hypothetical protein